MATLVFAKCEDVNFWLLLIAFWARKWLCSSIALEAHCAPWSVLGFLPRSQAKVVVVAIRFLMLLDIAVPYSWCLIWTDPYSGILKGSLLMNICSKNLLENKLLLINDWSGIKNRKPSRLSLEFSTRQSQSLRSSYIPSLFCISASSLVAECGDSVVGSIPKISPYIRWKKFVMMDDGQTSARLANYFHEI